MSYNLSLTELRDIIKNNTPTVVETVDDTGKYLLYLLRIANLLFYGDTLGADIKKYLEDERIKLQNIYDDIKSSYGTQGFYNHFSSLPNPRDLLYFLSGNRDDLLKPYDDASKALSKAISSITPEQQPLPSSSSSSQKISAILSGVSIYDDDLEIQKALSKFYNP